jgi:signal transduction histidine kinase
MKIHKLASLKTFLYESLTLSGKLFGIYIVLALVLSFWISSYTESLLKAHLQQQLEEQGRIIANDIANVSVNYLLTENVHAINNILSERMKTNDTIEYILVFDWNNELFTHTLPSTPSQELLALKEENMQVIKTEKGYIWDFSAPITEYGVGAVRVGISESKQLSIVKTILFNILFSLIIFFFVSAIIVSALQKVLTKPITDLVKGTQILSKGNFKYRVPNSKRNDEMGKLITSFNQMADDLEKYEKKTAELDKKRKLLLEKIINLQEDERKIISMELHDEIGQSLTGVKLNLKSLETVVENVEIKERITDLHKQVTDSLKTIHDLVVDIGPRFLEGDNIGEILKRYAKEYQQRYGMNVTLEIDVSESMDIVDQAKASIFRIMQEALTNIAKYAQATDIYISLETAKNHLLLIIEDNGIGFDAETTMNQMSSTKSMGLFSMQERATLLGGTFLIDSEKNVGTTIFVRIPLMEVILNDSNSSSR